MTISRKAPLCAALLLSLLVAGAPAEAATGEAVFDRTAEIVKKEFYRPSELGSFDGDIAAIRAQAGDLGDRAALDAAIDKMLAGLKTSHTARYTPDKVDYYELLDVFRYNYRKRIRDLYPPEGEITSAGPGSSRIVWRAMSSVIPRPAAVSRSSSSSGSFISQWAMRR